MNSSLSLNDLYLKLVHSACPLVPLNVLIQIKRVCIHGSNNKWRRIILINKKNEQLKSYISDDEGKALTTNQGLKMSEDEFSLKAGVRGPTLMEDFHFREKMTHFDHERIPERVVHARGFAAHGEFECMNRWKNIQKRFFCKYLVKRLPFSYGFQPFRYQVGPRYSARCPGICHEVLYRRRKL